MRRWDAVVAGLPNAVDFLLGFGGGTTLHYHDDDKLLQTTIETMLATFLEELPEAPRAVVSYHPKVSTLPEVNELIGEKSVTLFCYRGDLHYARDVHHWVCGVAGHSLPEPAVHVACSMRYADILRYTDEEYEEVLHKTGRYSNDTIAQSDPIEVEPGTVFRIATEG